MSDRILNHVISVIKTLKENTDHLYLESNVNEEAAANSVGDGSKVGLPPTHEPPGRPRNRFIFQKNTRRNWKK